MKLKITTLVLASIFLVTGCTFSVDWNDKIEIENETKTKIEMEYKILVDLGDGRLIMPVNISAGSAVSFLHDMQEDRDYHFIVESFGGSAYDCLAILNRIEELQRKGFVVTTETYGYNMSAGTFVYH